MSKRSLTIAVTVFLLTMSLVGTSIAVPAPEDGSGEPIHPGHNLSWGIDPETNPYLDYYLHTEVEDENGTVVLVHEPIYYWITYIGTIPTMISSIPTARFTNHWALNGSRIVDWSDYFKIYNVGHAIYNPLMPIGNWTHLTLLIQSSSLPYVYPNVTLDFIDNTQEWGFSYTYYFFDAFIESTSIWFKSDGTLENVQMSGTIEGLKYEVTLTRVTVINPMTIYIGVGAAIGVVALIIVVYFGMKRRQ
ncbi:MAG: hypothetical protein RTU30_09575 [Candidatus Thorarchaeota archaeon]